MKINVLGTTYEIIIDDVLLNKDNFDGLCDSQYKKIYVRSNTDKYVLAHEIIHAFLFESGLESECDWNCEEMVDWVAKQLFKIKGVVDNASRHIL